MSRLLPRLVTICHFRKLPTSSHLLNHSRYILQHYATSNNDNNDDDNSTQNTETMRLSTQYPPLPLQERHKQTSKPSGKKIEPYKDVQFKPDSKKKTVSGEIPLNLDDSNVTDKQTNLPTSPEEELSLGGVNIDPLELKKMIPHGTASKQEIEEAIAEENAEWRGVHWSERTYTAKLGDIVDRQRPEEIKNLMECSKPAIHRDGLRSIQPVEKGGPAYPIFYDPKTGDGLNRPQSKIPKDIDARKARVMHIDSLKKVTNLNYSECAMEYDNANGQYSIALERLRGKQIYKLHELTGKGKQECKKVFDQCLGNFDKALVKLQR